MGFAVIVWGLVVDSFEVNWFGFDLESIVFNLRAKEFYSFHLRFVAASTN
jgi:hypothetical protein